ncbi:hypothetical protein [Bacillus sp. REN10]|uniref:hypothetical protein n=1 Tax=Bacillus sp. REN10 TaxID=2782541 RepID=UPI00193B2C74|nr:hypothetical protein [Bacillus sp. REN10]
MDKPKKQRLFLTISSQTKEEPKKKKLPVQDWQKGGEESAAAVERDKEEEFQWVFPDESEKKEETVSLKATLHPQHARKRVIGKLLFIIISAILIGLLFGYTMVKIVTQKEEVPPQAMLKEPTKQQHTAAPTSPTASSLLPSIEVSIVQGGVFSTKEAANKAMKRLNDEGAPAGIIHKDEQFIVVLGVASELATAKELGEAYRAKVDDVYAKTTTISSSTKATKAKTLANVFLIVAEESAKTIMSLPIDKKKLAQAEKEVKNIKGTKKDEAALLQRLLLDAVNQAKSDQPQAAQAAQEKLLAFLAAY